MGRSTPHGDHDHDRDVGEMNLLLHLDFDLDLFRANLTKIKPSAVIIADSARTGAGLDAWADWLLAG